MKQKKNKGISLIVLIITIVVIIILATAVIVNLVESNIIQNSEFAIFINEYASIEEAERLYEKNSLLEAPYVKKYAITNEKVVPGAKLQKILKQVYGDKVVTSNKNVIESESTVQLYKLDLEKLQIKGAKYEYALNINDGEIFLINGHMQKDYVYFTPKYRIVASNDKTPPEDFNISAYFKDGYEEIEIKVGDVIDNESNSFNYEYHIQNVVFDETVGEITNIISHEKIINSTNTYNYVPKESGYYNVYVVVYDESGNSKQSINNQIVHVNLKNTIHVSTNGTDNGNGTKEEPYATITKAIESASNGDKIFVWAGEYTLTPYVYTTTTSVGICDNGKEIEIIGQNEKTILFFDGETATTRDGNAICLNNSNSVIRNLTYVFKPKASADNYSRAIFTYTSGSVKNVFFSIRGNSASYLYYNDQSVPANINNCTFFHETGSVLSNYSGTANFTNIATNVNTNGSNTNVITEKFTKSIINSSRIETNGIFILLSLENESFNDKQVGVFYGEHSWDVSDELYYSDYPYITVESANISSNGIKITNEVNIKSNNKKATGIIYKIDDGQWQEYNGKFKINIGSQVYAKYKFNDKIGELEAQIEENILNIQQEAIDNNIDTNMIVHTTYNNAIPGSDNKMYINVDEGVIGKTFNIKWYCWNWNGNYIARIHLLDENKNVIQENIATVTAGKTELDSFVIPQGTKYFKFTFYCSNYDWDINYRLYDMYITD